jgi:hypothetical protein
MNISDNEINDFACQLGDALFMHYKPNGVSWSGFVYDAAPIMEPIIKAKIADILSRAK